MRIHCERIQNIQSRAAHKEEWMRLPPANVVEMQYKTNFELITNVRIIQILLQLFKRDCDVL